MLYNSWTKPLSCNFNKCYLLQDVKQEKETFEITKTEETHGIKKKYEGEIEELKTMFFAEIQVFYVI